MNKQSVVAPRWLKGGSAWLMAGAPVLALAVMCMVLASALLWSFARKQDEIFARHTAQLVATAYEAQLRDAGRLAFDYAFWNDAYQNVTVRWDGEWVSNNYYSNLADGVLVVRADGAVRHAWFAENIADPETLQTAAAQAAISQLSLAVLDPPLAPETMTATTSAIIAGEVVIISLAPISPEEQTVRTERDPTLPVDYFLAVNVLSPDELAALGERLGLEELRFEVAAARSSRQHQTFALARADGVEIGALIWKRHRPGSAAFAGEASTILLVLLFMALAATLLAQRLAAAQVRAAGEVKLAQEASRMKSEFMSTMSHELRTPLNAIIGYGELIQEEARDHDPAAGAIADDAERLLTAARHLARLINDVLDQTRIDTGRLSLACELVSVRTVANELEELMTPLAQASGNTFTLTVDAAVDDVFADPLRLHQCLVNLVANALKFTSGGAVSLRVTAAPGRRGFVSFEVADTGIGIDAEEMKGLFKPFGQANRSIAAKYGGAGLGLCISRSLARAMGGDITAESEPGEGSVFTLVLPARASEPGETARKAHSKAA